MRKEVCEKMTTNDILICLESSCMPDDSHKIRFCKSWKKAKLENALQDGFLTQCVPEKLCPSRKKRKKTDRLANQCRKVIKAFPKRV